MLRVQPATLALAATLLTISGAGLPAQMHRVQKSEPVTRAVAVYEYAGDLQKPTAARLIPVSLFIGGHFEDAGSYLSRPVPLALGTDTVYELQRAGEPLGTLDLAFAKNLRGGTAEVSLPFDQAWFGYGRFTAARAPAADTEPKPGARHTQKAYAVTDDGRPLPTPGKPDPPPANANSRRNTRDTTDVDPSADRAQTVSLPDDRRDPDAPNPDRPTLRRRPASASSPGAGGKRPKETASVTETPVSPDRDPDRPTIKRKEGGASADDGIPPDPSEVGTGKRATGTAGTVTAATTAAANGVLSDNGRPELRRNTSASAGSPATTQAQALPDLQRVSVPPPPPDLHFAVAVSDMRDRAPHRFDSHFDNEADRLAALAAMRMLALEVLHKPSLATDATSFTTEAVGPGPAPDAAASTRAAGRRRTATTKDRTATRARAAAASTAGETLQDEQFNAFTLSYSGPLTCVYTAHTATAPVRYVTVVAQRNLEGKFDVSLRSVTDSAHLDRTPRYRLVDAVDADATNRGDLLFELRNQTARQFALYRFLGSRPDQVFTTGTTK